MFLLLGISILLAALLSFNSFASSLAALAWRICGSRTRNWPAAKRARLLFLLRTLPIAFGLACMALLIFPAYVEHEPRGTTEEVSYKLALLAALSGGGILLAAIRGFASWRATRRLLSDWLTHATPISFPGINIPSYKIKHHFPVIAIVGILRPKLFVAAQVMEGLQAAEISSTLRHEVGHLRAHDNLKRGLLRACRDALLLVPCGRALDRQWAESAEVAADEHAAESGRRVALDLASALVKIARMIPSGARPAMPAGAFLVGDDLGGLPARVRRLLQLAGEEPRRWQLASRRKWVLPSIAALSTVILLFQTYSPMLATVHSFIEHGVHLLR